MTPFTIYIGCGFCGGDLERVTGTPYEYEGPNRDAATVLKCKRDPHHKWVVRMELMKAPVDGRADMLHRKSEEKARRQCSTDVPRRTVAA